MMNSQPDNTHYAIKTRLPLSPLFYLLPGAEFLFGFEAVGRPKRVSPLDLLVKSQQGWSVGATPPTSRWSVVRG